MSGDLRLSLMLFLLLMISLVPPLQPLHATTALLATSSCFFSTSYTSVFVFCPMLSSSFIFWDGTHETGNYMELTRIDDFYVKGPPVSPSPPRGTLDSPPLIPLVVPMPVPAIGLCFVCTNAVAEGSMRCNV